jgi:hypothetical protein
LGSTTGWVVLKIEIDGDALVSVVMSMYSLSEPVSIFLAVDWLHARGCIIFVVRSYSPMIGSNSRALYSR